jgi:aryl-alcohol dehydrogenase-like predicted oxidoreductase
MAPPPGLPKMEYRFLGRSGLQVSAISLGGWLTYGGHVENGKKSTSTSQRALLTIRRKHICMHEGCL